MNLALHPLPAESDLRMTSMQIAELTGKEHKHVMRDIDVIVAELLLSPNLDLDGNSTLLKENPP